MLVANNIGPILMIAFTNHALDHMLCSVLDAGITTDIVRLGSRASEERISQYSIETRETVAGQSRLHSGYAAKYRELVTVNKEISQLIKNVREIDLESDSSEITKHLSLVYPDHHVSMSEPPAWVSVARDLSQDGDSESGGKWQRQGPRGQVIEEDTSLYAFWKNGGDVDFLEATANPVVSHLRQMSESPVDPDPGPSNRFELLQTETTADAEDTEDSGSWREDEDNGSDEDDLDVQPEKIWMTADFVDAPPDSSADSEQVQAPGSQLEPSSPEPPPVVEVETRPSYVNDAPGFFEALGEDGIPAVPLSDRALEELLEDGDVWNMSRYERQLLHEYWIEQARTQMQKNQQDEFERLRKMHASKVQEYSEIKEQVGAMGLRVGGVPRLSVSLHRFDVIC